jgi:hypothetical protein
MRKAAQNGQEARPIALRSVWETGKEVGILSTDLYKLYINPLLDRLQDVRIGLKIGNINVSNTGCADDIALLSAQLSDALRIDCMHYVLL